MNRTIGFIDTAIGALKAARDDLRHDHDVLASDLSGVIGTTRELAWTIDTLAAVLVETYARLDDLGHDDSTDPTVCVGRIIERLAHVRRCLDSIDGLLGDAHNHAAKLHQS